MLLKIPLNIFLMYAGGSLALAIAMVAITKSYVPSVAQGKKADPPESTVSVGHGRIDVSYYLFIQGTVYHLLDLRSYFHIGRYWIQGACSRQIFPFYHGQLL